MVSQRKKAHKHELKNKIIEATRVIFQKEGSWQGVTMRKIAQAIDYSLPTIYEYFENKDALLSVVQQEGYDILCCMLDEAESNGDQQAQLQRIATTFWQFAWRNPELYSIMYLQKNMRQDHQESIDYLRAQVKDGLQNVLFLNQKISLSDQLLHEKIDIMHAVLHGFISMALAGNIEKEYAYTLMMQTLSDAIRLT